MHEDKLRQVVEALIFATDHALPINELIATLENVSEKDIRAAIERLNSEYDETGRAFLIREQAGGLRFVTKPEYHNYLGNLFKGRRKARLSRAALETLSIVAYKQPVSRAVIEAIRGVNIDGVVTTLLERNMITIAGRGDGPGRPLLYKTTRDFLEYFGLKNLGDLPNLREIKEIFQEGEVFRNLPDEVVLEPLDDEDDGDEPEADLTDDPDTAGQPDMDEAAAADESDADEPDAIDDDDDDDDDGFDDEDDEEDDETDDLDDEVDHADAGINPAGGDAEAGEDFDEETDDPDESGSDGIPDADDDSGEPDGANGVTGGSREDVASSDDGDDAPVNSNATVEAGHDSGEENNGQGEEAGRGNPS